MHLHERRPDRHVCGKSCDRDSPTVKSHKPPMTLDEDGRANTGEQVKGFAADSCPILRLGSASFGVVSSRSRS